MGSALSSSIVEDELNGNFVINTPTEEEILAVKKQNKVLASKFKEFEEKFLAVTEKNRELEQKLALAKEKEEKNEDILKANQVQCTYTLVENSLGPGLRVWPHLTFIYLEEIVVYTPIWDLG